MSMGNRNKGYGEAVVGYRVAGRKEGARGPRVAGETQSLAQRAREHRDRADGAHPEDKRPLDQVADAALETGLEPREPCISCRNSAMSARNWVRSPYREDH